MKEGMEKSLYSGKACIRVIVPNKSPVGPSIVNAFNLSTQGGRGRWISVCSKQQGLHSNTLSPKAQWGLGVEFSG